MGGLHGEQSSTPPGGPPPTGHTCGPWSSAPRRAVASVRSMSELERLGDRAPVLVGVGTAHRDGPAADDPEPVDLMVEAATAALGDADPCGGAGRAALGDRRGGGPRTWSHPDRVGSRGRRGWAEPHRAGGGRGAACTPIKAVTHPRRARRRWSSESGPSGAPAARTPARLRRWSSPAPSPTSGGAPRASSWPNPRSPPACGTRWPSTRASRTRSAPRRAGRWTSTSTRSPRCGPGATRWRSTTRAPRSASPGTPRGCGPGGQPTLASRTRSGTAPSGASTRRGRCCCAPPAPPAPPGCHPSGGSCPASCSSPPRRCR